LVRPIFTALRVPERVEFIDMPATMRDKYQYSTKADIDHLRASGYAKAVTPLSDAVTDYVTNYLRDDRRLDPAAVLVA
ncbi:MAG: ADP-L-glycero-D-mannoheptose-6-epimerase, partial [Candidatus Eremiobacteraeota bacterium]|nr:ADP-L-glycero-D-mannoheptose-6-epimerase [Candidatus Eremiobacteraeota bacterium]